LVFLRLAFCLTRDAKAGDVVEKCEMEGRVEVDAIGCGRAWKSGRNVVVRERDMVILTVMVMKKEEEGNFGSTIGESGLIRSLR
jgi:hypothetical protein